MGKKLCWITQSGAGVGPDGKLFASMASTRYRVVIPVLELHKDGYESDIFNKTEAFEKADKCLTSDIIVFSKSYRDDNVAMALVAKKQGIKIVFDICDYYFDNNDFARTYIGLIKLADLVICNSDEMEKSVQQYEPKASCVITDPYESVELKPHFQPGERIVIGWYGFPKSLDGLLEQINPLLQLSNEIPIDLHVTTTDAPIIIKTFQDIKNQLPPRFNLHYSPWSPEAQDEIMKKADIIFIPSPMNERKIVKSPNRLIEALRYGKAVVASPLPCYLPFGEFAFVCEDLMQGIRDTLKDSAAVEARIAKGQDYIRERFAPSLIGQQWKAAIESLYAPQNEIPQTQGQAAL